MSYIETVSNYCAKGLSSKVPNEKYDTVEDQIEVFSYGLMVIFGAAFKGVLLVTLASILGVVIPALALVLTFSSLRVLAGGYHMQTYNKCMAISMLQFLASALISQYTYQHWSQVNTLGLLLFSIASCIYIIIRYIPRDNPNKVIDDPSEIKKFKKWSIIYLLIWSISMSIFLLFNIKVIVIASCFGLLLELFSISELGYQDFYARLDK